MESYKTTKAVRFRLEADDAAAPLVAGEVAALTAVGQGFKIRRFINRLGEFLGEGVQEYLYDAEGKVKDNLAVKNTWLKSNAKREIAGMIAGMKLRRGLAVKDIKGLRESIEKVFNDVWDTYEKLFSSVDLPLHDLAKRAAIGLLLKRLQVKSALPYLISFVEDSSDKNETGDLSLRLKRQAKDILEQLEAGVYEYLPPQSGGLEVARASFNFYTINKKPVDFGKETEKLNNSLIVSAEEKVHRGINVSKEVKSAIVNDILDRSSGKKILLGDAPEHDGEGCVSLRQILKNIKSEQKAAFNEFMTQNPQFEALKGKGWYLFSDITENEFDDYRKQTKEIERVATQKNQCERGDKKKLLQSDLQKLKKQRGALINAANKKGGNENNFKTYKAFADFYRKIAMDHGKILARLKGIERERVESATLKYWAVVAEVNNRHKLVLIPRENAGACRVWLDGGGHRNGAFKIFWFESFTFRSLRKLCFGFVENETKSNTFYDEWKKELTDYRNVSSEIDLNVTPGDRKGYTEEELRQNEQRKIKFYKAVLGSGCAKRSLNIPTEQVRKEIVNREFKNLDEFQIALEKICYLRFATLSANAEAELKKYNAQIFDITSLDLKNPESAAGKAEKYEHSDKRHTKIWKEFWTAENENAGFEIRLNPEIKILYRRPKQSRVNKYGEGTERYNPNRKNRYLRPQYTLVTTISEHSNSPAKEVSFVSEKEYTDLIDEFNGRFKKEDIKFAFGIDNGETELSTLGVYLPAFKKDTKEERLAELSNVEKYGFDVLAIGDLNYKENDCNGKERKIVQNPSYFLNKDLYMRTFNKTEAEYGEMFARQFEEKRLLTLDLTTAKVVCGRIVTNGDVPALLNLWLKHAQRNIFEMNDHIKDKTGKKILLKDKLDTDNEKRKFAGYISHKDEFDKLSGEEKARYVQWIFEDRDSLNFTKGEENKFERCQEKKGDYRSGVLFAASYTGVDLQSVTDIFDCRHVFKRRGEFYSIKPEREIKQEIDSFNTNRTSHAISNEELDLRIVHVKSALAANAVGVIDFLYRQYRERFGGEGLIVKEGFDTKKVEEDMEKFSGNIYRILERRLYRKFQNYGLVPPIKNLMAVRAEGMRADEKNSKPDLGAIVRLGNIGFVNETYTSQECPVCGGNLNHEKVCPKNCGFNDKRFMHSNDGIAGFNIAKRGFENFLNEKHGGAQ